MPAAAQKVFNAYDATLPKGIWGQFASQMLQGLIDGVKNAPHETAKMAQAIVSQVTQAVTYGQGVAAAAKQGGGYNPWGGGYHLLGTFGTFATPTTTAGGPELPVLHRPGSGIGRAGAEACSSRWATTCRP